MFRLTKPLGRSLFTNADDVLKTKTALRHLGYYATPAYGMTPYPDEPLFEGIERYQKDRGLRRDGVMNPEGETATTLQAELGVKDAPKSEDPSDDASEDDDRQVDGNWLEDILLDIQRTIFGPPEAEPDPNVDPGGLRG